jgi:replicative DNA helicase
VAGPPAALRAENDRGNPLLGVPATMSGQVGSKPGCCATLATLARTATGLPSVGLGLVARFAREPPAVALDLTNRKHRNGPTGTVALVFLPERELLREEARAS